jgi:RNA polymerase sigma-70 factor (ECF subfamily)
MPTAWLHATPDDPSARVSRKESVGLAFISALHGLSAIQRATLLLRDVVGFSAEETAAALAVSVPAANSALFRARSAIEEKLGREPPAAGDVDEDLLARYIRAWETNDVQVLVSLLREDVRTTMPPRPTWIDGRAANVEFYRRMLAGPPWVTLLRIVLTSANGLPALAFYRAPAGGGTYTIRALQVVELVEGGVARIDHFMIPAVFVAFGLPAELPT